MASSALRSFKRVSAFAIVAMLLGQLLPIETAAAAVTHANVSVTEATRSFNPNGGENAHVSYRVEAPTTALSVQIRIYRVSPATPPQICNPIPQNFIAAIDGPADRAPNDYSATWNGRFLNQANMAMVPQGYYCFRLRWDNAPAGDALDYGLREGIITVFTPPTTGGTDTGSGSGTGSGTGTGSGNTGGGSGTGTGTGTGNTGSGNNNGGTSNTGGSNTTVTSNPTTPCTLSTLASNISGCVTPTVFDPTTSPPQSVTLYYTLNRRLDSGLTVALRKADDSPVRTFVHTTSAVNAGAQLPLNWNGRYNGVPSLSLPQGFYKFVFLTGNGGYLGMSEHFQIAYTPVVTPPPPPPQQPQPNYGPFVTMSAPASFVPQQGSATITYTVSRPVTNFRLTVQTQLQTLSQTLVPSSRLREGRFV